MTKNREISPIINKNRNEDELDISGDILKTKTATKTNRKSEKKVQSKNITGHKMAIVCSTKVGSNKRNILHTL